MRAIRNGLAIVTVSCLLGSLLQAPAQAVSPGVPAGPADAVAAGDETSDPAGMHDVDAARESLVRRLAENGVDADEAQRFADQLTDEDLLHFAAHPEHVNSAGAVPQYIWILLAVFLGVLILGAIF